VGVRDRQSDPGQPTCHQAAQERQPAGAVLAGDDIQPEDLALPVDGDPDRDQRVHDHRAVLLTDLLG
jgi:hypothetical protein